MSPRARRFVALVVTGLALSCIPSAYSVAHAEPTFYAARFCKGDRVRLIEISPNRAPRTIIACRGFVDGFGVAVSEDRRRLVVGVQGTDPGFDLQLCSLRLLACRDVRTNFFRVALRALAFARSDKRLAMAALDQQWKERLWEFDPLSGKVFRTHRTPQGWRIIAIAPGGRTLLFGKADYADRRLYVGKLLGPKRLVRAKLAGAVIAFDGSRIMVGATGKPVCSLVELRTGTAAPVACVIGTVGATLP